MTRFYITLLVVSGFLTALSGCTSWPSEYKGVTLDEVEDRARQAKSRPIHGSAKPDDCSRAYFAHTRDNLSTQSTITETWESCLTQLRRMEQEAQARRARKERNQKQKREQRLRRLKQEREDHGPRFLKLYNMAKYGRLDKANALLKKYSGEYRINPHLQVESCSGGVCRADFPDVPQGMTGSGKSLNLIVKGIHAEPGRKLSEFELVRFESYGHGTKKGVAAVFTRSKD